MKHTMLRATVMALALAGFVGVLPKRSAHAQAEPGQAPQPGPQAVATNQVVIDRVAAVVGDVVILQSELALRALPFAAELRSIADPRERERRYAKLTGQLLDEMIAEELIVQAAAEAKIEVDAKEINAALDEIKSQNNLDDAGLEQALAMQGMSIEAYKKDMKRQILRMRALTMMVRPRVTVTDEDVRARYDEMTRRSAAVSQVHLRHVLIAVPKNPSEQQVAAAKERAAAIIEQAKQGASFSELAQTQSDDEATAAGGGDLGWIERGSLPSEWEVVVFSMDKGEVRGPISGPSGFHVFYVEDLKKSEIKPFAELKEQLRNELYRKEMDKQTATWVEELRKKSHISRKL